MYTGPDVVCDVFVRCDDRINSLQMSHIARDDRILHAIDVEPSAYSAEPNNARFRDQASLQSGAAILVRGRSPQKRMYDATVDIGLSMFPFLRDECESSSWSQNARLRSSLSAGAHLFRPIERSGMVLLHHHVRISRPGPQPLSLLHTCSAGATLGGLGRL
jgi:hypothetical protein